MARRLGWLALALLTVAGVYCQKKGVFEDTLKPKAGFAKIYEVSATSTSVAVGDSIEVRVKVTDLQGNPLEGKEVLFSTDLGTISPSAETDSDGVATAVFRAGGRTGEAKIRVELGEQVKTLKLKVVPSRAQGQLGGYTYTFSVSPKELLATGMDTALVTVTVIGPAGSPAPGVRVFFCATVGRLSEPTASTDSEGKASCRLIAPSSEEDLVGQVTVAIDTSKAGVTVPEPVAPPETVRFLGVTLNLEAEREAVPADGMSRVPIVVSVKRTTSGVPVAGLPVSLGSDLGDLPGEVVTGEDGTARAQLKAGKVPGTSIVRAQVGELADTVSVKFTPLLLEVRAVPSVAFADGESTVRVSALLSDSLTNNPIRGAVLRFETTRGSIPSEATTDDGGLAEVTLRSPTTPGEASVTVRFGPALRAEARVRFTKLGVAIYSEEESVLADGVTPATLRAKWTDEDGRPVQGRTLRFFSDAGRVEPSSVATDARGEASASFVPPADSTDGLAHVWVVAGDVSDTLALSLVGVTLEIEAEPPEVAADGASTSRITARLRETTSGRGLPSRKVEFETNLGSLLQDETFTDARGRASVVLVSSRTPGTATVRARYGGFSRSVYVEFSAAYPHILKLSAEPKVLLADGESKASLRASVLSADLNPVPDGTEVGFRIIAGGGSITRSARTSNGVASVEYTASTVPETVRIEASSGAARDTVEIVCAPFSISLFVDRTELPADGVSSTAVVALLQDERHNPLPDREVRFSTTLGVIGAFATTGADGRAKVELHSARTNGTAQVVATYGAASETTYVTFSGVSIEVSASPSDLLADGRTKAAVRVVLKDAAGRPLSGQEVRLEATLGRLLFGVGETDTRGAFVDSLWSDSPGESIVRAEGAGASGEARVYFTDYRLRLRAEPSTFAVFVGSSTVTAELTDGQGNPVEGARISFATTSGRISPAVTVTGPDGSARANLTGTTAGPATVTATAEVDGGRVSASVEVVLTSAEPASVMLRGEPIVVRVNGGQSSLRAVVTDSRGNPVRGAFVGFTLSGARGGARIEPATAVTDENGVATASFIAGAVPSQRPEDVEVVAFVQGTEIVSEPLFLTVAGAPAELTLGYTPPPVSNGDGTFSLKVAALVSDVNGNPAPDGTLVYFGADGAVGVIESPVATSGGKATTLFTYPVSEAGKRVEIRAQSGGISESIEITIPGFSGTVADVTLTVKPDVLLGNGEESAEVEALVTDTDGNPVGDVLVTFEAEGGRIAPSAVTGPQFLNKYYGTPNPDWGVARVTLVSEPVREDRRIRVVARAGGKESAPVVVTFKGIELSVRPDRSIVRAGEEVVLRTILKESATHTPISGALLRFGTSLGTLPGTATTDASGVAVNVLKTGEETGRAEVMVWYGALAETTYVDVIPAKGLAPASISFISADPPEVGVRGSGDNEFSVLTFEVRDEEGNPVADGTLVLFSLEGGLDATVTDSARTLDGKVRAVLRSGTRAGTVRVIARVAERPEVSSGAIPVSVHGGPPDKDHFSLAVEKLNIAGRVYSGLTDRITAYVFDRYSNPVPEGTSVYFSTTGGGIEGSARTDARGQASVDLISAEPYPEGGLVTVTAQTVDKDGNPITATIKVLFSGHTAPIYVEPSYITVPEGGRQAFTYIVSDEDGNPLVEGTRIKVTSQGGKVTGDVDVTLPDTQDPSWTRFSFIFQDEAEDETPPQITIEVTSPNGDRKRTITTAPPVPTAVILTSEADRILADGEDAVELTAVVLDAGGNMITGIPVHFSADVGDVEPAATTDSQGRASVTYRGAASEEDTTATIVASVGDLSDTVRVRLAGVRLNLEVEAGSVLADGTSKVEFKALFEETTTGAPVVGREVRLSAFEDIDGDGMRDAGEQDVGDLPPSAVTDDAGKVEGPFNPGVFGRDLSVTLRAEVGALSDTAVVRVLGISLDVEASDDTLVLGGSTEVRAVLREVTSGAPLPAREVRFSSTMGVLSSSSAFTDAEGVARIYLTSGTQEGTAWVTASYGPLSDKVGVAFVPSAPAMVDVEVSPSSVLADGESEVEVLVSVRDEAGLGVPGARVELYASAGEVPREVTTGPDGRAKVRWIAPASSKDVRAQVIARAQGPADTAEALFQGISLKVRAEPSVLTADGVSQARVTAELKVSSTLEPISGASVRFATDVGAIEGSSATDSRGLAEVTLTAPSAPDTARVVAYFGRGISDTTYVIFEPSTPTYLALSVEPTSLAADGRSTASVRAVVTDQLGKPVSDGTAVRFGLHPSEGSLGSTRAFTVDGEVSTTLTSSTSLTTVTVEAWVEDSPDVRDSVQVEYVLGPPALVTVESERDTLPADGITTTTITATVTDAAGHPIPGVEVRFSSNIGTVTERATTDSEGRAEASFSGSTTGAAIITATCQGVEGRSDPIELVPGPPVSITLSFEPNFVHVRGVGRNSALTVTADVRDAHGNPVADGTEVVFDIYASPSRPGDVYRDSLSSYDPVPTVGGRAQVAFISGSRSGTARIRARLPEYGLEAVSTEFQIFSGPVFIEDVDDMSTSHLSVAPKVINIYGWNYLNNRTELVAILSDRYHNPVPEGTAVYFTTTGGSVVTSEGYTDSNGVARATLITAAPFPTVERYHMLKDPNTGEPIPGDPPDFDGDGNPNDGIARVLATSEGVTSDGDTLRSARAWWVVDVVFSGPVAVFQATDDDPDDSLAVGESTTITLRVYDVNGNPVVPESKITATASAGKISPSEIITGDPGTTTYTFTLANNLDPKEDSTTASVVTISLWSKNGNSSWTHKFVLTVP